MDDDRAAMTASSAAISEGARSWGLASLAAGAGAIHLAMVPSHMGQWAVEGVAFAIVGWLQLAVAWAWRPARRTGSDRRQRGGVRC